MDWVLRIAEHVFFVNDSSMHVIQNSTDFFFCDFWGETQISIFCFRFATHSKLLFCDSELMPRLAREGHT